MASNPREPLGAWNHHASTWLNPLGEDSLLWFMNHNYPVQFGGVFGWFFFQFQAVITMKCYLRGLV